MKDNLVKALFFVGCFLFGVLYWFALEWQAKHDHQEIVKHQIIFVRIEKPTNIKADNQYLAYNESENKWEVESAIQANNKLRLVNIYGGDIYYLDSQYIYKLEKPE